MRTRSPTSRPFAWRKRQKNKSPIPNRWQSHRDAKHFARVPVRVRPKGISLPGFTPHLWKAPLPRCFATPLPRFAGEEIRDFLSSRRFCGGGGEPHRGEPVGANTIRGSGHENLMGSVKRSPPHKHKTLLENDAG